MASPADVAATVTPPFIRKRSLSKPFFIIVTLLLIVIVLVGYLLATGQLQKTGLLAPGPKVELKTQYQNPFKAQSQYVNPFQEFKNPFDNL